MTAQTTLSDRITQEMASFQKTMDELQLLKMVTRDLRSYKKLIKIKKFD